MAKKIILSVMASLILLSILSFASSLTLSDYYKFNENNGTTALDSAGNFNLSGLTGDFASGKLGNAFSPSGVSSIDTGTTFPNTDGKFSFSFWIKRTGTIKAGDVIFGTSASNDGFLLVPTDEQSLRIYIPFTVDAYSDVLPLDEWVFITATYDGDTVKFYTNDNVSSISGISWLPSPYNLNLFGLGDSYKTTNYSIDDLRFYDNSLNQEQVSFLYNSGAGTESTNLPFGVPVYNITNCTDLQSMKFDLAGNYTLTKEIDCFDTINWNGGQGFEPIGDSSNKFTGVLVTNSKKIKNLYINRPSTDYVGLFGYLGEDAFVTKKAGKKTYLEAKLTIEKLNVTGHDYVGGFAGRSDAIVDKVEIKGKNSVTGNDYVGGSVGYNNGNITQADSKGGVVYGNDNVGGFVGYNSNFIGDSYSHNDVWGDDYVGGFAGFNHGTLFHVYAVGKVNGVKIHKGGLVGGAGSEWESSFWDFENSGINDSIEGFGKTTAEMLDRNTYVGWDFVDTWHTGSYPEFFWEAPISQNPTNLIQGSGDTYNIMRSAGAGLGNFILIVSQALPTLLIMLAFVGIIVAIGMGIASVVRNALGSKSFK